MTAEALIGRDGWLFLTGDTNATIEFSTGQRGIPDALVRGWHRLLEYRHAWLGARGIDYIHVVVPNKEVVYASFLPSEVPPISHERLVCRVADRLAAVQCPVRFRHLLDALLTAAAERDVYARTDTHWNGFGAYHAYLDVMDSLGDAVPHVVQPDEIAYSTSQIAGDVGSKLDPPVFSEMVHCGIRQPRAQVVFDNNVMNNGRVRRTCWAGEAVGPKVLVFHDSFYNWMLPFFAESFPQTVSVHNFQMDLGLIEEERPDVVVTELTERFMVKLPDDLSGLTAAEFVRMKAAGDVAANL